MFVPSLHIFIISDSADGQCADERARPKLLAASKCMKRKRLEYLKRKLIILLQRSIYPLGFSKIAMLSNRSKLYD